MPRPLVFGDGERLIQIDDRGRIRDLAWPIGIWNHLSGRAIRVGFWTENHFQWCDSDAWSIQQKPDGQSLWQGQNLEINLQESLEDGVFHRVFHITNRGPEREIRWFQTQAPHLLESDIGDCALLHHELGGILHYKGPVALLFGANPAPDQWACGITGFAGMEGTWRDAEDGDLSMNAIAQGSVDSTMRVSLHLEAGETKTLHAWIEFADSPLALKVISEPPLLSGGEGAGGEGSENSHHQTEIQRHLAIMRTQIASTGAILAANDSDIMETNRANYSYCWMRDGAHIAETFLDAKDPSVALNFLKFAQRCLHPSRPYFLQKYRADATLGASWHPWYVTDHDIEPLQEDETAAVVSLAARVLREGHQSPEAENLLKLTAFLLDYRTEDGLPKPSYDLWEERRGVHVYTVATVIRALRDTGHDPEANQMTESLLEKMWDPKTGGFARRITSEGSIDWTADSSSLFVGLLNILPIGHEAVRRNADHVERTLWLHAPRAGLARYENDYYFRVSDRLPGNPWIISTLWLAQHRLRENQKARAEWILDWVRAHAAPTGVLPEQIHPETGAPLSVSPLTWSHSEFVKTLLIP